MEFCTKIILFISALWPEKKWNRLASVIAAYRKEVPCLISVTDTVQLACANNIYHLLNDAEKALMLGDINKGWKR